MVDVAKGEGALIPIARDDEGWAIPGWAGAGAVAVDVAVVGAVAWAGVHQQAYPSTLEGEGRGGRRVWAESCMLACAVVELLVG